MNIHEETLKIACNLIKKDPSLTEWVISKFPKLKESEDEKIRKAIIYHIQNCDDTIDEETEKKMIAWLEKQGNQKTAVTDFNAKDWYVSKVDGKIHDMTYNPADKVESKFKVGDWIVQNGLGTYKIVEVCESWYEVISYKDGIQYSIGFDKENDCHLWTIQDAKDGDVLQLGSFTVIFQEYIGNRNCKCYCSVYKGEFEIPSQADDDNIYGCYNAIPATKEQRDLLFQNMKEAGYEFDFERKELKKIEFNPDDLIEESYKQQADDLIDMVTEKSAWTKEDKERYISCLQRLGTGNPDQPETINSKWFKEHVYPHRQWKPSEEQMDALHNIITGDIRLDLESLTELHEQLKRL